MDIKLPHSLLKDYLQTSSTAESIAQALSLSGPTVDRLHKHSLDQVYDIEVITNRIDSVSAFGIAREAAVILPQFDQPAKLINSPYQLKLSELGKLPAIPPLQVQVLDHSLLPRLSCIALSGIKVKPSDPKTQHLLELSGIRSINNVVDISNELTLRFGCPVHIFDADKINGNSITIRESKKGETITTLDGKLHQLPGKDIVITDADGRLIDLCGVMGGSLSEVDENTTNILLFVPVYHPAHIRKTSLAVQNRTLAAQIYEKSPDPELTLPTLIAGIKLLQEKADGNISSNLFDYYPTPITPKVIEIDLAKVNQLIGTDIPEFQATEILKGLGFTLKGPVSKLLCTVPSWRAHDITILEDIVEEIARVYGYFRLQGQIPSTAVNAPLTTGLLDWELKAKHQLAGLSFTEILTSSLSSAKLFSQTNLPLSDSLKLANPLSEDFELMRTSLIPGVLSTLALNKQLSPLKIFELSNVYLPVDKQKLPHERSTLTFGTLGLDYRLAKGYLESLFKSLNVHVEFESLKKPVAPFATLATAQINAGRQLIGHIGAIDPQVANNFSLTQTVIIVDLDFEALSQLASPLYRARPLPQYPSITEDITLSSSLPIGDQIKKLKGTDPLIVNVEYVTSLSDKHTFRLEFNNPKGSLTQTQVNKIKSRLLT